MNVEVTQVRYFFSNRHTKHLGVSFSVINDLSSSACITTCNLWLRVLCRNAISAKDDKNVKTNESVMEINRWLLREKSRSNCTIQKRLSHYFDHDVNIIETT